MNLPAEEPLPITTRLAIDALALDTAIKALIATHPDQARFATVLRALMPLAETGMTDGGFVQEVTPEVMQAMRQRLHQRLLSLLPD